jgi:D-glycero-D-manno-heptose 1,7-bisphosphate phosphatase
MSLPHKGAFFDRDGTLITHVPYLARIDDIKLIKRAAELCLFLQNKGYKLFVITNQSGIGRGFFDEAFVQESHQVLDAHLKKQGVIFTKFYYCPHHPPEARLEAYKVECACRKPGVGMLQAAQKEFGVDLQRSLMFGDQQCDIDAGLGAGCRSYLIDTVLKSNFAQFDF